MSLHLLPEILFTIFFHEYVNSMIVCSVESESEKLTLLQSD